MHAGNIRLDRDKDTGLLSKAWVIDFGSARDHREILENKVFKDAEEGFPYSTSEYPHTERSMYLRYEAYPAIKTIMTEDIMVFYRKVQELQMICLEEYETLDIREAIDFLDQYRCKHEKISIDELRRELSPDYFGRDLTKFILELYEKEDGILDQVLKENIGNIEDVGTYASELLPQLMKFLSKYYSLERIQELLPPDRLKFLAILFDPDLETYDEEDWKEELDSLYRMFEN